MNDPPPSQRARDEIDAKRLRNLGLSRTPGYEEPLRERAIIAEIVASYWTWTRNIARGKLGGLQDPDHAADDVTQRTMRKLAKALENKHDFNKPLRRVVLDNIKYAKADYFRALGASDRTPPVDLDDIPPDRDPPEALPSEEEQARAFAARLDGLLERDRRIAIERFWVGRPPEEIAALLGISRNAVDVATHRAIQRLRDSHTMDDVRPSDEDAA